MPEETRTLVLIELPMARTPVAPHRPGTYVLGYLAGDQQEAHDYLNQCKKDKVNALIHNAWLVQIGIEFAPAVELDSQGRPVRGPDGHPIVKRGQMDVQQGFALLPLTKMDAINGCDWGVEALNWTFPKGSMIQDLESHIEVTKDNLLHSRTGITRHPAGTRPQG